MMATPDVTADELHDEVVVVDADDGILLQTLRRILQGRFRLLVFFQRCLEDDEGRRSDPASVGMGGISQMLSLRMTSKGRAFSRISMVSCVGRGPSCL